MKTYQIATPSGNVVLRPCLEFLPEAGQTYTILRPFVTRGGYSYFMGQRLTLLGRTSEAPYGFASSLKNWKVKCPYTESVWSEIEGMIADGTLSLDLTDTE